MHIFDREWRKGSRQIKNNFNGLVVEIVGINIAVLTAMFILLVKLDGINKLYALLFLGLLIIVDIPLVVFAVITYKQYKLALKEEISISKLNKK